jgi:hypothetical protein
MKALFEMPLLEGQTEEISMTELRANPGDVFAQVQMGKSFTIAKNGTVIAEIKKPEAFDFGALQQLRNNSNY